MTIDMTSSIVTFELIAMFELLLRWQLLLVAYPRCRFLQRIVKCLNSIGEVARLIQSVIAVNLYSLVIDICALKEQYCRRYSTHRKRAVLHSIL